MPGILGALIQRGWQANKDRALLESLASYGDGSGTSGTNAAAQAQPAAGGGGGFDPSQAGQDDDEGPSPAAQRGMQADALRKVIMAYHPDAKDMHTALKGMSADQLEGIVKGFAVRSMQEDQAAQAEDRRAQAQMRRQNATDDQAAGQFVNNFLTAPGQEVGDPEMGTGTRPPTLEERWAHAAQNTPNFGGRVVPKVIEALSKYSAMDAPGAAGTPVFREGPFPGTKVAQVPGSKKWQLVTDPNATSIEQATDEEGNPIQGVYRMGNHAVVTPAAKAATRPVPESFHRAMDQVTTDITSAQSTLDDETADKDKKARAQRMLKAAQAQGKSIADRYHAAGDIPDELHSQAYQDLGLPAPKPAAKAAAPAAEKRITVQKGGKKYSLPASQKAEAVRQGYTVVGQ